MDLQQSKGIFMIKGIIEGKDNPANGNGFKSGTVEKGKSKGSKYNSIKFKLKTSKDNMIPVELFGMEKQKAYFYNKKLKKTVAVDWAKRKMKAPEGYNLIVPEFDVAESINTEYKDGDVIRIVGEFQFSTYTDKFGTVKPQTRYVIKQIHPSQDKIDFNDPDFKELNEFSQDIIVNSVDVEAKVLYVNANIIGYANSVNTTTFEVNTATAHPAFINTLKSMKFGDFIRVIGVINHKIINEETDGAFGKQIIKDYKKSLEIIGADPASYEKKKYKESDFVDDSQEANFEEVSNEELPFNLD